MSKQHRVNKAVDSIQKRLTDYACALTYADLSPEAIHGAKARIIDTLGALVAGFFGEPCRIAGNLAAQMPNPNGATVIGTRLKTALDMAAFVNGLTARDPELTDMNFRPGSFGGHPSDALPPVLSVAEHAQVSGRDFLTAVVLTYEAYLRVADVFHNKAFDYTNLVVLGSAVGAGKLLGLSRDQLSHCISMAVVPNVILRQVRTGHLSMYKCAITGHAGRAGVFASMLAQAGMEGPHLPFEGKAGWCEHVAREKLSLGAMGGDGTPFRIMDTQIKNRSSNAESISSVLAAEKVAPLKNLKDVKKITVEVYKLARDYSGVGEHCWNVDTRESADHSIPFVTAATLIDGTLTPRSYNEAHLWNPELRELMQKIEVVENEEFTKAFHQDPQEHRTRVTVVTQSGERMVGETGGDADDMSTPKTDAQVDEKFRGLTEDSLGAKTAKSILDRLWHLEDVKNVAAIPPAFVLD